MKREQAGLIVASMLSVVAVIVSGVFGHALFSAAFLPSTVPLMSFLYSFGATTMFFGAVIAGGKMIEAWAS